MFREESSRKSAETPSASFRLMRSRSQIFSRADKYERDKRSETKPLEDLYLSDARMILEKFDVHQYSAEKSKLMMFRRLSLIIFSANPMVQTTILSYGLFELIDIVLSNKLETIDVKIGALSLLSTVLQSKDLSGQMQQSDKETIFHTLKSIIASPVSYDPYCDSAGEDGSLLMMLPDDIIRENSTMEEELSKKHKKDSILHHKLSHSEESTGTSSKIPADDAQHALPSISVQLSPTPAKRGSILSEHSESSARKGPVERFKSDISARRGSFSDSFIAAAAEEISELSIYNNDRVTLPQLTKVPSIPALIHIHGKLSDSRNRLRQWAVHCMFLFCYHLFSPQRYEAIKTDDKTMAGIKQAKVLDWKSWDYNDAEELLQLIRLGTSSAADLIQSKTMEAGGFVISITE
ncbi:hypothetical protein ADUPG1_013998 [Aduncisulcus paluster]|uniref:Uncharacterized protein n=1 Tax=Aduncisulcus paluster TaxID=2918883 RepID=A0ABQ5K988_9EUKA|nr:hypothetical protein ADUPG1_013998 [Aduncisulcus paluster]